MTSTTAGAAPAPAARVVSGGVGAILTSVGGGLILAALFMPWATVQQFGYADWTRIGFEMEDWPQLFLCGGFILGVGIARHNARIHWLWQVLPVIPGAVAGIEALWYIHNILNLISSYHYSYSYVGGYLNLGPGLTLLGGLVTVTGALGCFISPMPGKAPPAAER